MKHQLISSATATVFSLTVSCLTAACTPSHFPREKSGIDLRLRPATSGPNELRPEGVLQFRGRDNEVSLYVPVAPLDPSDSAQRVGLPPGSYSVTYHPALLDDSIASLRSRAPGTIVSHNPFFVSVPEGKFVPIDVEHRMARPWPPRP